MLSVLHVGTLEENAVVFIKWDPFSWDAVTFSFIFHFRNTYSSVGSCAIYFSGSCLNVLIANFFWPFFFLYSSCTYSNCLIFTLFWVPAAFKPSFTVRMQLQPLRSFLNSSILGRAGLVDVLTCRPVQICMWLFELTVHGWHILLLPLILFLLKPCDLSLPHCLLPLFSP